MDLSRKPSNKSLTGNCGIGSTLARFYRFLLKDTIVVVEVAGLVFYCLARNIFSLLALVLIIGAFLARTLGLAALIGFLPAIRERIFRVAITGAIPVLEPTSSLSLTLLGVALRLYLNALSLRLGPLSLLSSISN
ncbi:hypothetical protein V2W45_1325712 [Cenococcum geophilum]